jgi:hypothetical protein
MWSAPSILLCACFLRDWVHRGYPRPPGVKPSFHLLICFPCPWRGRRRCCVVSHPSSPGTGHAGHGASVPALGDGEGGPGSALDATHSLSRVVFSVFLLLLLASKP